MTGILDALRRIASLLESMNLPYAVMGGIAVRVYAIPRPTYDVDFVLALARDQLPEFYAAAGRLGYTVPEMYAGGWVDQVAGMPVVKLRTYLECHGVDIDIFLAETEYQNQLIARRRLAPANGFSAWFVSPEDLILMKLVANRGRDQSDVQDILFVQGELDLDYMRRWAPHLRVQDRLEAALANQYDS